MDTTATSQTSFSSILLVAAILTAIGLVVYYFAYYRTQDPGYLLDSTVYSTTGTDPVASVTMMTPEKINKYLGENFTLSWYVTMTNIGGGTPGKFTPLIWVAGVGAFVVDMTSGAVSMVVMSAPYDTNNPAPSTQTVVLANANAGTFFNKWHQITLTITGANVCVYMDGSMIGNCITMPNVSLASPTGLYFLEGQGIAATVTSLQAFPYVMTGNAISNNYTATSDTSGNPTNIQVPGITWSTLGTSIIKIFCQTGLCPSGTSSDVTLGPFTQINYEYS